MSRHVYEQVPEDNKLAYFLLLALVSMLVIFPGIVIIDAINNTEATTITGIADRPYTQDNGFLSGESYYDAITDIKGTKTVYEVPVKTVGLIDPSQICTFGIVHDRITFVSDCIKDTK